jgi:hypothetical protein
VGPLKDLLMSLLSDRLDFEAQVGLDCFSEVLNDLYQV